MIEIKHKFSYVCILKSYQGLFLFIYLFIPKYEKVLISLSLSFTEFEGGIDRTGEDEAVRN